MINQANKRTLIIGVALILLTNAIVFAGVAYNRSGEPESQITLTERELRLPYRYQMNTENTGISLQLQYRVKGSEHSGYPYGYSSSSIDWMDEDKLTALGMDVTAPIKKDDVRFSYRHRQEKEVILVLEYDGSAYQAALQKAEQNLQQRQEAVDQNPKDKKATNQLNYAKENLEREKQSKARLFVIDVGLHQQTLREKYPDRSKYILLKGVIGMMAEDVDTDSPRWVGYVKTLSNTRIHVPLAGHQILEPMTPKPRVTFDKDSLPRYSVKLNIGKRLEPWVEEVKKLEN